MTSPGQFIPASLLRPGQIHWSLADQIVVSGTNFLTGVLIARYLGVAEFGVFSLLWMAVLFAQSIQHAAISFPMLSIGPKQEPVAQADFYGVMLVQQIAFGLASGLVAAGIVLGVGLAAGHGDVISLSLALFVTVFLAQLQDFQRRHLFAQRRADIAFRGDFVRCGLQLAGLAALFLAEVRLSLEQVLYLIAAAALVGSVATARFLPPLPRTLKCLAAILPRQLAFSRWLVGSALMQWTTGNLFILMAGMVLGPVAVGALKAAQNLLGVTHIFFQAADNFVPPRAADTLHARGEAELKALIRQVFVIGMGVTGVVAIAFIAAPEFWLRLIFGETYSGYGGLVVIMAVTYLLKAGVMPLRHAVTAMEQTRVIFIGSLLATTFTLGTSYPIVATYGEYGAAWGMACVQAILMLNLIRRARTEKTAYRGTS